MEGDKLTTNRRRKMGGSHDEDGDLYVVVDGAVVTDTVRCMYIMPLARAVASV